MYDAGILQFQPTDNKCYNLSYGVDYVMYEYEVTPQIICRALSLFLGKNELFPFKFYNLSTYSRATVCICQLPMRLNVMHSDMLTQYSITHVTTSLNILF